MDNVTRSAMMKILQECMEFIEEPEVDIRKWLVRNKHDLDHCLRYIEALGYK